MQEYASSSPGEAGEFPPCSIRKIRVPKLPTDDERPIESAQERRYRLQTYARNIIWTRDSRLFNCLRRPAPGFSSVGVRRDPDSNSARFEHLEQCNRVWTCPVCAQRITSQRRKELTEALAAAKLAGYTVVLVTYTLRHDGSDGLKVVLEALQAALKAFKSGRAWQDIKSEYSILGGVKALEMTFGENGWHPHAHELMVLDVAADKLSVPGFKRVLYDLWIKRLAGQGFDASFAHGIDVRTADSAIADYVAKWGTEPHEQAWGVEHEIAAAPVKRAHRDGLTPFQLLESYGAGDKQAGKLFAEYAEVMEGKHQLVWSNGLRALLKLPDELEDEQLPLEPETVSTYTAVEFNQENWYVVCDFQLRGVILYLVGAGDWTTLRQLLRRWDIAATIHEQPPDIAPMCDQQLVTLDEPPAPTQAGLFDIRPYTKVRYE